jgi:FkbM family methyltransferase
MTVEEEVNQLKAKHRNRQSGIPAADICIRDGIVLRNINESSRYGFEFFCFRSPEMATEMDWFIKLSEGKMCFIDIGAYHGIFSLVFCELNKTGVAFAVEAMKENYEMLLSNAHDERIVPVNIALSDMAGSKKYHMEWDNLVLGEDTQGRFYAGVGGDIDCISGDDICFERTIAPDIIKIDVEGAELMVLEGLRQTIANNRPTIFLETHASKLRNNIGRLIDLIEDAQYLIIDTATGKKTKIDPTKMDDKRLILIP